MEERELLLYRGKDVRDFTREELLDCVYTLERMSREAAERHTSDLQRMGDLVR